uniref:Uncharacterized protein n=1 Tax=Rhodnius prolixus TaxID=13249 RepID=A0ABL0DL28_RHOPR
MTGQIQGQYGGGFSDSPKEGGLYGEITLVHLYKAALTAGKAYNHHKHHHAHKFHHEGAEPSQDLQQPQLPQMTPLPDDATEYPFLRGMQLVPRLPVQELNVIRQQQIQQMQQMQLQQMIQQQQQGAQLQVLDQALLNSPFAPQSVRLFKRDHSNSTSGSSARSDVPERQDEDTETHTDSTKKKRTVDFGVFPGVDLSSLYTGDTGFILGGGSIQDLAFNGQNDDISEEGPTRKWNEPANGKYAVSCPCVQAVEKIHSGKLTCYPGEKPLRNCLQEHFTFLLLSSAIIFRSNGKVEIGKKKLGYNSFCLSHTLLGTTEGTRIITFKTQCTKLFF